MDMISGSELVAAAREALRRPHDYGYFGDLDLFGSWGLTLAQHRDSDVLERSNYQCILRDLGDVIESHGCDPADYVEEVHSSHWAVGWIDEAAVRVLIDEDGDITPDNITGAFRWIATVVLALVEQHPIYDESDYSEMKHEEALQIVESNLADIRNDAESAVDDEEDGARLVPEWVTAADVLSRMYANGADTGENHDQYDETVKAVWELAESEPVEPSTATGRAAVRGELALTAGDDDVYGWCLGWWFPIAETLHVTNPRAVPAEWKFRAGPLVTEATVRESHEGQTVSALLADGSITTGDLVYWGTALGRYADLCKRAGRDY